jgi:uncharacterized protein (DUF2147 family)
MTRSVFVNIKAMILGIALSACHTTGYSALNEDLTGFWRTVDDRTGFSQAIIKITVEKDGSYSGTIFKSIPRPNYTPRETCQHCPAPYTDKPMIGLKILTGLTKVSDEEGKFKNGKVLDPLSGRIYSGKARLSSDGRRLTMRGYVGISMLGRSQSWFRETEDVE